MDHDQRFKEMIRLFFPEFMSLFFETYATDFDLTSPEWLDKEVLPNPPEGERHVLDLVAKLRTKRSSTAGVPEECLALVHVEIEAQDRTTELKPRLPRYFFHLHDKHRLPVLPIALYLRVGMEGIGIDEVTIDFGPLQVMKFQYLYVGLRSLDALQYSQGENWLGVALSALIHANRDQWPLLGAEALRRLADAPLNDHQRFLLSDCVQAYLPLDDAGIATFERITKAEPYSKVIAMNKTPYDKGIERGLEQGLETGKESALRDVAIALLESKFRSVLGSIIERIGTLSYPELRTLTIGIQGAATIEELFPSS